MITQNQLRQYERLVREAEDGSTAEKVAARQNFVPVVKALLAALEESGVGLAVARIDELERERAMLKNKIAVDAMPEHPEPMARRQVRLDFSVVQHNSGKMAAAGKDG